MIFCFRTEENPMRCFCDVQENDARILSDETPESASAKPSLRKGRFVLYNQSEMVPSPFHGIFSAFQSEHATGAAVPAFSEDATTQQNPAVAVRSGKVGQIAVDIYELDNYYIIRAPIAGVKLSDIDIEVDDKVLTIRGKRTPADAITTDQFYLQECFWGDFTRSITLPVTIDPKKVKATFSKDSILKVLVPKEEKVKIVRISEG